MKKLAVCAILMFAANATWASNLSISDFSFENYPAAGYTYSGSFSGYVPGWTFTSNTGLAAQGSGFNVPSTPDGTQAAFLQGNGGTVSQSIGGFDSSFLYTLNVWVGTRSSSGCCTGDAGVSFFVDGVQIGTTGILTSFTPFTLYTIPFTVATSGAHTLALTNVSLPGDNTSFVDDVSISGSASAAPEPATFALIGSAFLALGLTRRRRA
uniref:Ice-binding protein C-terminal domain-containing protein n=1 Tax=Solibacter usitatus (strain Ellin6076) TaxID=234267 RepID=Q025C5_SOLUE